MIDLRTLLIDCRVALRALPGKAVQPLLQRLEVALTEVARDGGAASTNGSQTAQQVALAWQTVARGLKHTDAALYDELHAKVMALLGVRTLHEPAEELLALQRQVEDFSRERERMAARFDQLQERQRSTQALLDELHKALAAAVPEGGGRDAQAQAMNRLASLVASANSPEAAMSAKERAAKEGPAPSRAVLERISGGGGSFSREQRDWIIGEALGLTAWEFTPVELIEKGDQWLAALVLERGSVK